MKHELCCHKPRNYQKLGESPRTCASLVSSGGTWPCPCFDPGFLGCRTGTQHISVVEPPRLWYFIVAGLEN